MCAATYHGRGDVRVEEVDRQRLGPDQVRIEIDSCGIRGSDLQEYIAGPIFIPNEDPHPIRGRRRRSRWTTSSAA